MKGGIILKKIIRQLSLCCLAILCFVGVLAIGVKARGDETGNCTLNSVTLQINDVEHTFTGNLKPYKVSEDTDWETFLKNVKITQCSMIKDQDKCEKKVHEIGGMLKINDNVKSFLNASLSEEGNITNKNYEISLKDIGIDSDTEFIDVVFKFGYHARDNTSEINIRFIKSYPLTYNLDGGTLPKDSITSYHSQEEFTLPTPTKEGYDFAGWTGEGITTPSKNVTIPTGTKGARSYTANWTKKQPEATTTVTKPDTTTTVKNDTVSAKKQLAVGTKVTYKKAVYKITKSTSKSAEVTLLSIKNKKAKKFTIPTKIKLSDGRKAKVTGIAKKAFNKCKKLKKIVIKSEYLKKKKIAKNAFYGLSKKAKIKVPKKKQKVYQRWFRTKKLSKKIKIYS